LKKVYVDVRHSLFWYGVYGFCEKSGHDEVVIYSDLERNNKLAYFEITAKKSLEYLITEEDESITIREEIKQFLDSSDEVYYYYIYPRDEEDLLDQVKHQAPLNDKGQKPVYIDAWFKHIRNFDLETLGESVKVLMKKFFDEEIDEVEVLDWPDYEEMKMEYEEDY
jgi:hypothetical protein